VATEVLTAFHLDRYVVPCVLGGSELPQFLSRSVYLDLRKRRADALTRLGTQVRRARRSRNEFPGLTSYQPAALRQTIRALDDAQREILDQVERETLAEAKRLQAELSPRMRAAEARWRFDPTILNLAGYHRKNAYMLKHWEAYSAGRFPSDPLLDEGRQRFFATLFANPIDYAALNGLGNILLFAGELAAAEFFVASAIRCAARAGVNYREARHDLAMIRRRAPRPAPVTRATGCAGAAVTGFLRRRGRRAGDCPTRCRAPGPTDSARGASSSPAGCSRCCSGCRTPSTRSPLTPRAAPPAPRADSCGHSIAGSGINSVAIHAARVRPLLAR